MNKDYYYLFDKNDQIIKKYEKNDVINELYDLRISLPTITQLENYIKNTKNENDEITKFIEKYGVHKSLKKIKKAISKIDNKIPLYDIYSENLYIIDKTNVYNRVMFYDYRFPDNEFVNKFNEKKKK